MKSRGRRESRPFELLLLTALCLLYSLQLLAQPGSATYSYDDLGRLRSVTYEDGTIHNYNYDNAGNRTQTGTSAVGGALQFAQAAHSVGEAASTITINVNRVTSSTGAVSVQYATANITATAGADYTARSGTLSWAAGDTAAKSISVPILEDALGEAAETFRVVLSSPTGGAALGSPMETIVTITDNETIAFSIANVSVGEEVASGTVTLTVTKTGNATLTHAVNYATANGTATAGSDYTATSGTLTFASGETSKSIVVPILNNSTYEGTETFSISLSSPTNGAVVSSGPATVTITETDAPPAFSIADVSVSESATSLSFTVTKTGSTARTHAVNFASANGTAIAGADFTSTSGTLSFATSETSKSITVQLLGDTTYEGDESFTMTLSSATNGATISRATAVATIVEDDPQPQPGTFQFTAATYSASETSATASVLVSRTGGSAGAVSVRCVTSDGTAFAGQDYTAVNATLNWAAGDTANKTCTIPLINDSQFEELETINVSLTNATGGASLGSPSTAVINLSSEEPAPVGNLQFTAATVSVNENGSAATLTVSRINGAYGAASAVCSTTAGTAQAGVHYTTISQTVSWAANDASNKTCSVPILDNSVYGGNRTFTVRLINVSGANAGSPDTATVTIVENDPAPRFSVNDVTVREDAGTAVFTVTRTGGPSETSHTITFATEDGTANSNAGQPDFIAVNSTLVFSSSDTAKTISVTINNVGAQFYEGDEWFRLHLTSVSGGALIERATGIGTIQEIAPPPGFGVSGASVMEGGQLQFSIAIAGSALSHSVSYYSVNGSATAGSDYQAVSGTLTFGPGTSAQTVTVQTFDDTVYEGSVESMSLVLTNPTNGAVIAVGSATGSITDNDTNIPTTPLNLRTGGFSGSTYTMLWDASAGPVSYYQLQRALYPDFNSPTQYVVYAPATSVVIARGSVSRDFYFRVRACDSGAQCSAWSPTTSLYVPGTGGGGGGGGGGGNP